MGRHLRDCRLGASLTQAQLAELLGLPSGASTVSHWESGDWSPTLDMAAAIREVLPAFDPLGVVQAAG